MTRAYLERDARRGPRAVVPADVAALLLGPDLPGAACRGRAPEHDLDVADETAAERDARHARALARCAGCPAREPCARALTNAGTVTGIWGGRLFGRPARSAGQAVAS